MQPSRLLLLPTIGAILLYLGWIFLGRSNQPAPLSRRAADQAQMLANFDRIYGGTSTRILNFYSPEGDLMEGDHTTLCYGVVNAKAVRIEPPVDGVGVSLNRCVAVAPLVDTTYTLLVETNDGRTLSESLRIRTHPDPDLLPRVSHFRIEGKMVDRGQPVYVLNYSVKNAEHVSLDPPVMTLPAGPMGRLAVAPGKTTTYTLTVLGKNGHTASARVTVDVP